MVMIHSVNRNVGWSNFLKPNKPKIGSGNDEDKLRVILGAINDRVGSGLISLQPNRKKLKRKK